jgi:hypothetical protein
LPGTVTVWLKVEAPCWSGDDQAVAPTGILADVVDRVGSGGEASVFCAGIGKGRGTQEVLSDNGKQFTDRFGKDELGRPDIGISVLGMSTTAAR